jgi:hypothetical protein
MILMLMTNVYSTESNDNSPVLYQAIERLCFYYNSDANNCYISDLEVNIPLDFVYETTKNLYFTRAKLNCRTRLNKPCTVHFIIKGNRRLHLLEGTVFTAK